MSKSKKKYLLYVYRYHCLFSDWLSWLLLSHLKCQVCRLPDTSHKLIESHTVKFDRFRNQNPHWWHDSWCQHLTHGPGMGGMSPACACAWPQHSALSDHGGHWAVTSQSRLLRTLHGTGSVQPGTITPPWQLQQLWLSLSGWKCKWYIKLNNDKWTLFSSKCSRKVA